MKFTSKENSGGFPIKKRAAMRMGTHITTLPAEPGTTAQQDVGNYNKIMSFIGMLRFYETNYNAILFSLF
jgi:hypothetical protein